ncbi:AcrR family transcriptional regulator [Sphingomonas sp. UYAg733]
MTDVTSPIRVNRRKPYVVAADICIDMYDVSILRVAKPSYHHGDLANALVVAATAIVEQDGPEAISLRALAERLGVSRAAPYRHFADRDALLATVAACGFEDLVTAYENALAGAETGDAALRQGWRIYLDFAEQRPGLFQLMFGSDLLGRASPPPVMIPPANRAYELIWEAMRRAYPDLGEEAIKARTITAWSTIYGFTALDRARRWKPFMTRSLDRREIIDALIDAATIVTATDGIKKL